ncbi:KOW domain-containing RNA-binding protein [Gehongia tenuis]|jgi:large subunit ribosomal protein L14e|uniref:KOW domain-containing RNA-binding protein n=1 Tax=Gehongia tenuis TaxID=2763655 RepID=A0A926HL19_9FIRM|nr:KOW domain-containing RNA-binding protein [Gehongia tenuis]MBC8531587.1 KOW domain-containing RNA-binding protein [Gehongia tenuis]
MANNVYPEAGRVVQSRAGRDRGRYFIVLRPCDDEHVYVVDGQLRKLERPKKKKLKHLMVRPELAVSIQEKIGSGKKIFDSEIRGYLDSLGYGFRNPKREE